MTSQTPFPTNERLSYSVRWLGIHCGSMTLESYAQTGEDDTTYVIVMRARTSDFFDKIHKVRSRIESHTSGARDASVSYLSTTTEEGEEKVESYRIDYAGNRVIHDKNGTLEELPLDGERVFDPLAYLYKLRVVSGAVGSSSELTLATSKGAVPTTARVLKEDRIRTPDGRQAAVKVVPEPKDGMLFSRSGKMEVWLGTDGARIPYRIEFDLAFGKLVAVLKKHEKQDNPPDPALEEQELEDAEELPEHVAGS